MLTLNFSPFPILTTERLILRAPSPDDEQETYVMRTDERVNKYVERPRPASVSDARSFIDRLKAGIDKNEWIAWVITLKGDPKLIGSVCLWNIVAEEGRAEIGFELHPDHQGKGIMQKAMLRAMKYGFEVMQLKVLEGWVHEENIKSIGLMQRNGFERDHEMEEKMSGKDFFKNMQIYLLFAILSDK